MAEGTAGGRNAGYDGAEAGLGPAPGRAIPPGGPGHRRNRGGFDDPWDRGGGADLWDRLDPGDLLAPAGLRELTAVRLAAPPDSGDEPFDTAAFFDPDTGPPDRDEAWLAFVAGPAREELMAAVDDPEIPEAIAAGFLHRGPGRDWPRIGGGHRAGFAAGGVLDELVPGPVLAGCIGDAVDGGLPVLSDDELIGVLCATRRLSAWSASLEMAAIADLERRRQESAAATGDWRGAEHVADELAAALVLTGRGADRLLELAGGLTRLSAATAALRAGKIDAPRAWVFVDELAGLDDVAANAVAAAVAGEAPGLTTGQLRALLRRAVLALDPDAAQKRRALGERQARVEVWAEPSGTAALAGRDLPPAAVIAADKRITSLALALKAAGVDGTMDQLRAEAFTALLSGQPAPGSVAAGPAGPGGLPLARNSDPDRGNTPGDGGPRLADRSPSESSGGAAADRLVEADPGRPLRLPGMPGQAGLPGTVHLTLPLATWLGRAGSPGEVAGFGPLDAQAGRDLAGVLAAHPATRWCVTMTGPDDRPVAHACTRKPPPRGDPPGGVPPGDPDRPDEPESLSGGTVQAWLAGLHLNWLEQGECAHRRQTRAYSPGARLRHLIQIRNSTCTFPGCRRPAAQCDVDHTVPFDQGGRTCECNLGPACRRHHQAKQAPGWQVSQPEPGTFAWTLPHGRTYTARSSRYRS